MSNICLYILYCNEFDSVEPNQHESIMALYSLRDEDSAFSLKTEVWTCVNTYVALIIEKQLYF